MPIKPRETFRFVIENEEIDRFLATFAVILNGNLLSGPYIVTGKTPKTVIPDRFKRDLQMNQSARFTYPNEEPVTCCVIL